MNKSNWLCPKDISIHLPAFLPVVKQKKKRTSHVLFDESKWSRTPARHRKRKRFWFRRLGNARSGFGRRTIKTVREVFDMMEIVKAGWVWFEWETVGRTRAVAVIFESKFEKLASALESLEMVVIRNANDFRDEESEKEEEKERTGASAEWVNKRVGPAGVDQVPRTQVIFEIKSGRRRRRSVSWSGWKCDLSTLTVRQKEEKKRGGIGKGREGKGRKEVKVDGWATAGDGIHFSWADQKSSSGRSANENNESDSWRRQMKAKRNKKQANSGKWKAGKNKKEKRNRRKS